MYYKDISKDLPQNIFCVKIYSGNFNARLYKYKNVRMSEILFGQPDILLNSVYIKNHSTPKALNTASSGL